MAKSNRKTLIDAMERGEVVDVFTQFDGKNDYKMGFVVAVGKAFFALHVVNSSAGYDGWECIRIADFVKLCPDHRAAFYDKALAKRGESRPTAPKVDLDSPARLLTSAAKLGGLVKFRREGINPLGYTVGRIDRVGPHSVGVELIGPDALSEGDPVSYRLKDITKLGFGNRYCDLLERAHQAATSLSRKDIVRRAVAFRDAGALVKLVRRFNDTEADGFIVGVGRTFLMMAIMSDGIFDGYSCLRIKDIRQLNRHDLDDFVKKPRVLLGQKLPPTPKIDLSSIETVLKSVAKIDPLIEIYGDEIEPDLFTFGRFDGIRKNEAAMIGIGKDGKWRDKPGYYLLSDITRIDFLSGYEDTNRLVYGDGNRRRTRTGSLIDDA